MKLMIFIWPPHLGQTNGSTSETYLIWTEAVSGGCVFCEKILHAG
jgi:hypothetical protein